MNCAQVQELLSAHFDGELTDDVRLAVAEHVEACSGCARELAGFEKLSAMAARLTSPAVPASEWSQLTKTLDDRAVVLSPHRRLRWPHGFRLAVAVVATLLVALGIGWFGYRTWFPEHRHVAVFDHYLEQFQHDPTKAQELLLAHYKGEAVDAHQVARKVGYRPAVANGLPAGYSVDSTFVVEMPCCTCVQTLCKRRDGSVLVVFEHDDDQPNWFRGRSCIMANCGGKKCSLVGMDSQLAVSWKRGTRHLTVVGARDVSEVDRIVSWLDGDGSSSS